MRAGFIVTAVLGLGTALVFGAAAVTATLFPSGTMVGGGWNGGVWMGGKGGIAVPEPAPVVVDDSGAGAEPAPAFTDEPLPPDAVPPDAGGRDGAAPEASSAP